MKLTSNKKIFNQFVKLAATQIDSFNKISAQLGDNTKTTVDAQEIEIAVSPLSDYFDIKLTDEDIERIQARVELLLQGVTVDGFNLN